MASQCVAVNLTGTLQAPKGKFVETFHAVFDSLDPRIEPIELLDQTSEVAVVLTQTLQLHAQLRELLRKNLGIALHG